MDVILDPDVGAAQRDAIRRILEDSAAVADFSFQSKEESTRIFRCLFAGEPDAIRSANLSRIPAMFLVSLQPGTEHDRLVRRLRSRAGVFDASPRCAPRSDLEVYFALTTTPEAILTFRATLDDLPRLTRTVSLSKEGAYEEFACLFADRPKLVENTSPATLPASIRLDFEPGTNLPAIAEQLRGHPDVELVRDARFPVPIPEGFDDSAPGG